MAFCPGRAVAARPRNGAVRILLAGQGPPIGHVLPHNDGKLDLATVGVVKNIAAQLVAWAGVPGEDRRMQEVQSATAAANRNIQNVVRVCQAVGGAGSNLDQAANIKLNPSELLHSSSKL